MLLKGSATRFSKHPSSLNFLVLCGRSGQDQPVVTGPGMTIFKATYNRYRITWSAAIRLGDRRVRRGSRRRRVSYRCHVQWGL
jgi:hypothetical protein